MMSAAVLFILKGDMPLLRWNIMKKFSLLITLINADKCKWNRILRPSLSFIKSYSKFKVTQNSLSCEIIAAAETVGGGESACGLIVRNLTILVLICVEFCR
jgi:hypothetical protein